jgi:hypothetical protein
MKITFADKGIAWLTLLSGLAISAVAVYYSVAGLISIFAAAAIPIAVMGIVLELSKLVATVWLKQNWFIAPRLIRAYLLIAVAILMLITSMGIFGYLSKAHLDQAVPTGDVAAQVALLDEKIKTERDNIDANKRALQQMDAQVDQMLGRSDTERGAERAVAIRKNQAKERASLQADIAKSQKAIAVLNQERAPVASELRKVEAEVGPIKYIAALLYGDNPDTNVLERAVRWVIILIVVIFDPLAVVLLLASQYSFQYFRRIREEQQNDINNADTDSVHVVGDGGGAIPVVAPGDAQEELTHCPSCGTEIMNAPGIGEFCPNKECDIVDNLYGNVDPEVTAFFKRLRVVAKLEEIEDEQGAMSIVPPEDIPGIVTRPWTDEEIVAFEKAHAEINPDDPNVDGPMERTVFEPKERPYPFPMERPLEGDDKLEQDIIDSMPVFENEELWASRVIDEDEDDEDKGSIREWKLNNPHDTIKRQRVLYEKGLIENLPWDTIEKFDEESQKDYEPDDGPLTDEQVEQLQEQVDSDESKKKDKIHDEGQGSADQKEKVEYVQNSEQNNNSIWSRITEKKTN